MYKDLDKNIEESLEEMSNFHPEEKDEIWNKIENKLFSERRSSIKPKRKKGRWGLLTAAAVVMIVVFGIQTETGSALVDKVKSMFEPEKEIVQNLEGMEEETNLQLNEGKESEYVIYVDEERYVMTSTEDQDTITTKEPLDAQYPEVSMTISQVKDRGTSEVVMDMKEKVLTDYPNIIIEEEVSAPLSGYMFFAKKDGVEWNTEVTKVYVLDNGAGGSFVIQQRYFSEAEEGHGVRFDEMVKEFHIVKN